MSSKESSLYVRKKSKEGQEVLCPVGDDSAPKMTAQKDTEECVEEDVVGRYAGNIRVQKTTVKKNGR